MQTSSKFNMVLESIWMPEMQGEMKDSKVYIFVKVIDAKISASSTLNHHITPTSIDRTHW